jgi:hypothetical protein
MSRPVRPSRPAALTGRSSAVSPAVLRLAHPPKRRADPGLGYDFSCRSGRLHDSLPRPDTSISLTEPGNGRAPLISAEMVDSDSEEGDPETSSVAGQDAEPVLSQSVSQPAVAETPVLDPVSGTSPPRLPF